MARRVPAKTAGVTWIAVVLGTALAFGAPGAPPPALTPDPELVQVAAWMAGDFDTFDQVASDEAANAPYRHIRAVMHIVPVTLAGLSERGRTFYAEQAAAEAEDKPYRQRVYLLTRENGALLNRVYRINDPAPLVGAWKRPDLLASLTVERLHPEEGCDLTWTRVHDALYTGVAGLNSTCRSAWRGGTHVVSQTLLTPESITSLDQGFDDAGAHTWGPRPGTPGHVFVRRPATGGSAATAREFARLRAGDGSGEVVWYVEGTVYTRGDRGALVAANGLIGYNVARLAAGPGPNEARVASREVFVLTDLERTRILADRAPTTNTVSFGIGVRAGRAVAGIGFTSNGRDMSAAVPPVEIVRVASPESERFFTVPFVNAEIGGRRWWASELYEFAPAREGAGTAVEPRLVWLREGEMAKLGRVHVATSGRRFTSLDAVASSSPLAARLVALVRDAYPEFATAPVFAASPPATPPSAAPAGR